MSFVIDPFRYSEPSGGSSFPVVESISQQSFSAAALVFDVELPSVVNAGDLLWLHLTVYYSGTIATPTGWTNLRSPTSVNIFAGLVASGVEGGTSVTVSKTGNETAAVAQVIRISNWSGSLADIESAATDTLISTSSFNPPSLSPSWGADNTMWLVAYWAQYQVTNLVSFPADTTNQHYQNDGGAGGRCELACATRNLSAGSWDPSAFQVSANQNYAIAYTFAIKPAS